MTDVDDVKILSDNDHVLLRPGMYIGPITVEKKYFWVIEKGKMVNKEIEYIPGLYKIFCEVLDNAIDEHQRGYCDVINVNVDFEKNRYSVSDNGRGISPDMHECGKHTPEVVFTMLRSGTNFDDHSRETIGMNGVGAALTNIFSEKFAIEIKRDGKLYMQTFRNNNSIIDKPVIKKRRSKESGTTVSFFPDKEVFSKNLNPSLIYKRCIELSYMFPELTINLNINGMCKKLTGKKFEDFVKLFGENYDIVENKNHNVRLAVLKSDGNGFSQFSIVNGADTYRGGSHVDIVKDIFVGKMREILKKKYKLDITPNDAAKHLMVILFQKINAPQFDGQTKERLSTDKKEMGVIFEDTISPRKLTMMTNGMGGIIQQIYDAVLLKNGAKEISDLRKAQRGLKSKKVTKLIDCNAKKRNTCTLYITEGDSAVGGLSSVRDPKTQAGLPLRGKILNISGKQPKEIIKNQEIQSLMSTIGLEIGKSPIKISNGKVELVTLRYGNISILTDADHDGSAIRCLLINFFYRFWPELLDNKIITISEAPIYRVINKQNKKIHFFYSRDEFDKFIDKKSSTNYKVSYYKGLGSCDKLAWNYFINENPNIYPVTIDDKTEENLDMAFGDDSDKRKEWLR